MIRKDIINGQILFPDEYCEINQTNPVKEENCYCYVKGDTTSLFDWFSSSFDLSLLEYSDPHIRAWRHYHFSPEDSQKIIDINITLKTIDSILKIHHCFIMEIERNSWVSWHYDFPRKGPVLNLLLTPEAHSHSYFPVNFPNINDLIECKYKPKQFCLYNTDFVHGIKNYKDKRYLFSAIFERGLTDLSWQEAKIVLSDFIE